MKKVLLSFVFALLMVMTIAQNVPMSPDLGNYVPSSSRDNEYVCMPNAMFSQINPWLDNAYFCQLGYPYYRAADDYNASAPFSKIRIWGGDFYSCPLAPGESFDIMIWDGEPYGAGNLIFSATLSGATTLIGVNVALTDIYQIDINLGTTITQLTGWIGVTRNNASCDDGFAWVCYGYGNSLVYDGTWYTTSYNHMMCLGGEQQEVPISNWALFIGIGLILTFAIVRFRKAF